VLCQLVVLALPYNSPERRTDRRTTKSTSTTVHQQKTIRCVRTPSVPRLPRSIDDNFPYVFATCVPTEGGSASAGQKGDKANLKHTFIPIDYCIRSLYEEMHPKTHLSPSAAGRRGMHSQAGCSGGNLPIHGRRVNLSRERAVCRYAHGPTLSSELLLL
jgi:hypothetical protein